MNMYQSIMNKNMWQQWLDL